MNERIRLLAEQAQDWADAHAPYASEEHEYFVEKFAELIVRECINEVEGLQVSQSTLDWSQHWNLAIAHTALHLKEHFGVKESLGWVCSKCGTDRTKAVCPLGPSASVDGRCPMIGFSQ